MRQNYEINPEHGLVIGRLGKPITNTIRGYICVRGHAGRYVGLAHRMIWEHVHGPIPVGMQINHINGNKSDNRIANLELVTPGENLRHAYRIGLARADGEYNGRAIGKSKGQEA